MIILWQGRKTGLWHAFKHFSCVFEFNSSSSEFINIILCKFAIVGIELLSVKDFLSLLSVKEEIKEIKALKIPNINCYHNRINLSIKVRLKYEFSSYRNFNNINFIVHQFLMSRNSIFRSVKFLNSSFFLITKPYESNFIK